MDIKLMMMMNTDYTMDPKTSVIARFQCIFVAYIFGYLTMYAYTATQFSIYKETRGVKVIYFFIEPTRILLELNKVFCIWK